VAKITALRISKGRSRKVNISLDDGSVLSLGAETALKKGLLSGQELSAIDITTLKQADRQQGCHDAAARYLGYRPRSEQEMRQYLKRHHFNEDDIEAVLGRLKEQGLVDDAAFAAFWKENRQSFSPRSSYLTGLELRQKGVPKEVIEQAVGAIDDDENAYRAAQGKARSLKTADYQQFRHRLGDYLRRRGFGYGTIITAIERLWREREENTPQGGINNE